MPDTYTTTLGAILMGIGGDNNQWGSNLNTAVIQIFEDAIANTLATAASAGQLGPSNTLDLSTAPPPAGPSAARWNMLVFSGAITANQTVIVPNLSKAWLVLNATSGGFTVSMKTPTGTAVVIPQFGVQHVVCWGPGILSNVITVFPFNTSQVQMPDGVVTKPSYSFVNETNSGWYRAGTQDWRLSINGVDVLQVTGTGAATPSVVNILSPEALQIAGQTFGGFTTGDVKLTFKTVADPGWVMMNDSTMGDASSNATYANANCSALWQLLYNNIADADAPILTSGGVATTRGAQGSAATAFAAHCRLTLPLVLGRALAGAGSGAGLTPRALGHAVGEETHALVAGEIPAHTHSGTTGNESATHTHHIGINPANITGGGVGSLQQGAVAGNPGQGTDTESATHTHAFTTDGGAGLAGTAHNNIEPRTHLGVMIKL
jgi:microcystin-dependent protein